MKFINIEVIFSQYEIIEIILILKIFALNFRFKQKRLHVLAKD